MNLPQAKSQLEKIIALYKSMSADEKNISTIERDLMLGYIRSLYENFLDTTPSVSQSNDNRTSNSYKQPAPVEVKPLVIETAQPPVVEPLRVEPPPPPRPVEQPKRVEILTPAPEPVRYEAPPAPVRYEAAPAPVRYEAPPAPVIAAPRTDSGNSSAEIEALFEEIMSNELSDRLSNTAIADLTKAFGLNDRLLMQNELFANNKAVFDEILKDLNNASSFESAKGYLIDFAKRYHWVANNERQKHAKWFIKMVRRRFK